MANKQISIKYRLKQLNNANNNAHLLWFPHVDRTDTLSLRGLADHIQSHGTPFTRDTIWGVLMAMTSCMVELLKEGVAVKLDGLGTFYPTMEAKGAESPVGYNITDYIKGLHIRFTPENSALDRITSRELKKDALFRQTLIVDKNGKPKKVVDGQLVDWVAGEDDDNTNQGGGTNDNG